MVCVCVCVWEDSGSVCVGRDFCFCARVINKERRYILTKLNSLGAHSQLLFIAISLLILQSISFWSTMNYPAGLLSDIC